jgi:hypothetical protein
MGERDADGDVAATGAERAEAQHTVAIAPATAELLAARAAALGLSVGELIAALAGSPGGSPPEGPGESVALGAQTEPSEKRWREVKAWIDSWGKPDERPRPKFGK